MIPAEYFIILNSYLSILRSIKESECLWQHNTEPRWDFTLQRMKAYVSGLKIPHNKYH